MQEKPGFFLPVQAIVCFVLFSGLATSGSLVAQDSCAEAAGIGIETINGSTGGVLPVVGSLIVDAPTTARLTGSGLPLKLTPG